MNPRQQIARLLQQWREISQSEFAAIQAGDWPQLRTLQTAKESLQQNLNRARDAWNAESPIESFNPNEPIPFAAEVSSLVEMEIRKTQLLEARRNKLRERQNLLRQSRINIRRVRNSYAGEARAKWQSYS